MKSVAKPSSRAKTARNSPRPIFTADESAFLAATVEDGIRIQPRFRPEPLLVRTGRGFMESTGISEIAAAKQQSRASRK